jgi:hypothetical protein
MQKDLFGNIIPEQEDKRVKGKQGLEEVGIFEDNEGDFEEELPEDDYEEDEGNEEDEVPEE